MFNPNYLDQPSTSHRRDHSKPYYTLSLQVLRVTLRFVHMCRKLSIFQGPVTKFTYLVHTIKGLSQKLLMVYL